MCQRGFEKFFFHSVQHFWPSEDEEKVECCGNVQSLFFQQMLPRHCPQSQHCSRDIAVSRDEDGVENNLKIWEYWQFRLDDDDNDDIEGW